MKEHRIVLTEITFTGLCKSGFFKCDAPVVSYINFTKVDLRELICGKIVEKTNEDHIYKFILQDIGIPMIIEILKRSPIYSDLSYEF